METHDSARLLEMAARKALDLDDPAGLGGILDADFIDGRRGGFAVICAAIAPYYMNATPKEKIKIDDFLNQYRFLNESGISNSEYFDGVNRAAWELNSFLSSFTES